MAPTSVYSDKHRISTLPDRIRLDRRYDAQRLKRDVHDITSSLTQQFYVYYSPVLLVSDVTEPAEHDWAKEPMLKGCLYLQDVLAGIEAEIKSVRLMRLEAGAELKEHTDPMLDAIHQDIVRLTLPVFSDEHVLFLLNGTEVPMKPGELWYMRLSAPHSVHNNSVHERINISIDVVWNDWLDDWLRVGISSKP